MRFSGFFLFAREIFLSREPSVTLYVISPAVSYRLFLNFKLPFFSQCPSCPKLILRPVACDLHDLFFSLT